VTKSKRMPRTFGCPVELSVEYIRGKWKPVILARLKERPCRYGDLRRQIPALSDKVLTDRLRELEDQGLVAREPSVTEIGSAVYRLTKRGESLRPLLQALYDWGTEMANELEIEIRDRA
jgi:DNA-binding HxlR family transcriptional regulator